MRMQKLKQKYINGTISKPDYINKMYKVHQYLSEYSDFIKNTNIAKIEISDDKVIATSRDNNIKAVVNAFDKRTAPVEIINFGAFEKNDFPMLLKIVDNDSTFFDIGANIGWVSMNVAKMKKNIRIFAFEPIKQSFAYLKQNIRINSIKNFKAFNFGFSDEKKELPFYFNPEDSGSASAANLSESLKVKRITCSLKKLDDFILKTNINIDCIKCDVEGGELFVLQGAIKTLEKQKPMIFVEMLRKWTLKFNYNPNITIALLKKLGYNCYVAVDGKLIRFTKMDDKTIQTNFFFLHKVKHADKIIKFAKE